MKRKFKQWWLTVPPISTKWATTSHLSSLKIKSTTTYDVRYGVKPVNGIPTFGSPTAIHICDSAHQNRWSGWNSGPISAEVALPRLQREIKVTFFLFASHSFLANYLRFMVNLIDKAIVINVKIDKNERKGFYSSNKEGLICWYKIWKESRQTSVNLYWRNFRWKLNPKSKNIQTDASCTKLAVELCCILIILTKLVICSFLKAKQSTCQILSTAILGT